MIVISGPRAPGSSYDPLLTTHSWRILGCSLLLDRDRIVRVTAMNVPNPRLVTCSPRRFIAWRLQENRGLAFPAPLIPTPRPSPTRSFTNATPCRIHRHALLDLPRCLRLPRRLSRHACGGSPLVCDTCSAVRRAWWCHARCPRSVCIEQSHRGDVPVELGQCGRGVHELSWSERVRLRPR